MLISFTRHVKQERKGQYPEMETQLYDEYKQLRKKGLKVKGWWFCVRGRQILNELNAEASFQFSNVWFDGFKERHHISLRKGTNVCQKPPEDKEAAIQHFHRFIRIKASLGIDSGNTEPLGWWTMAKIANVYQTPLSFTFTDGSTYTEKGEKTVWVRGGTSGLDKRQCTVQITLFADGEPRIKPLVIFRGKGTNIFKYVLHF